MDGLWLEDTRDLERRIREMMAHQVLPPEVVGYGVEFGTHWYGDPAVWLDLYVPSAAEADPAKAREVYELRQELRRLLKDIVPHRLAIVQTRQPQTASPA